MAGEEPEAEIKPKSGEDEPGNSGLGETSTSKSEPNSDHLSSQRVFKKSSPNNKLTLYLSSRDLVVTEDRIDRLQGVLLVDPEYIDNKKVFGQVTLTFRYGREDEEVMGLKFCNEAVMCLAQLYPPHPSSTFAQQHCGNTPLQDALIKRLGPNAYPFTMEITPMAPPSVQLVPAKEYSGAPIGTSYDVRAYIADRPDEKLQRKTTVRMGVRVVQRATAPPLPNLYNILTTTQPQNQGHDSKKQPRHTAKISTLFGRSEDKNNKNNRAVDLEKSRLLMRFKRNEQEESPAKNSSASEATTTGPSEVSKSTSLQKSQLVNGVEEPSISEAGDSSSATAGTGIVTGSITGPATGSVHSTPARHSSGPPSEPICSDNESSQMEHIKTDWPAPRRGSGLFRDVPAPRAAVDKPFLLSDGRITLEAALDKAIYSHGEPVQVYVSVMNNSSKTVRRIKVFVVQHVDVCMFSNGKFKNVVAIINSKDDCPISPGMSLNKTYNLAPTKGSTKNWIALEDSYSKSGTSLASTVTCNSNNPEDRNVFAIYVSYYVKVKLLVSVMGGELSLKLPFTLMHTCPEFDPLIRPEQPVKLNLKPAKVEETEDDVKPEKDGT